MSWTRGTHVFHSTEGDPGETVVGVTLRATPSGTALPGVGVGVRLQAKDGAGNVQDAADVAGVLSVVTSGSEVGYARLQAWGSGALATALTAWGSRKVYVGAHAAVPVAPSGTLHVQTPSGAAAADVPLYVYKDAAAAASNKLLELHRQGVLGLRAYLDASDDAWLEVDSYLTLRAGGVDVLGVGDVEVVTYVDLLCDTGVSLGHSDQPWGTGYFESLGIGVSTAPTVALDVRGQVRVAQIAATSGTPQALVLTGAAHTGLAQGTEATQVDLHLAQTYQWSGAASLSQQRFVRVRQPTIAMSSSQTVSEASTVYIDGAPVKGTNVSNSPALYALHVGGLTRIVDNTVGGGLSVNGIGAHLAVSPSGATSPAGGSAISALYVTQGAHTGVTSGDAVTYGTGAFFDIGDTVEFATGNLSQVCGVVIEKPTYAFVGASTITDAATLRLRDAPSAGTNCTITNSWALWVDSGACRFDGDVSFRGTNIGFFSHAVAPKPTVTGSRGGNAALASLLTALDGLGLLTDSSS